MLFYLLLWKNKKNKKYLSIYIQWKNMMKKKYILNASKPINQVY